MGRPSPVDGEAMTILNALELAKAKGWSNIVMEWDKLQVINILSAGQSSLATFGAIIESCFSFRSYFISLLFQFVKRSGNSLAHALATNVSSLFLEGDSLPPDCRLII